MESWSTNWSASGSDKADWLSFPVLPARFYLRNTLRVAPDLLGKVLVVRESRGFTAGRIVEVEAYRGNDAASHCSRGQTPRCSVMFEDPGVAYVYFIYGMYEMLNFVTEPRGFPGAVLIRSLEPLSGADRMRKRRGSGELTTGPGKLCRAMGIRMEDYGQKLQGPRLYVVDDGFEVSSVSVSPRVGIRQASDKYWRFFITQSPYLSRAPQNAKSRIWMKR